MQSDCGPLAHAAQGFAIQAGFGDDPPRGAPALRRLLGAIADQACAADGSDESFIEGAGAFLGVVLADRLGGGRHVTSGSTHGLALGNHGYFNPFTCVAETLAAPQQAKALLSGVAEAEAEADTKTHRARITAMLAGGLARSRQNRLLHRVDERVWVRVGTETLEVDLTGLLAATKDEPEPLIHEMVFRFAHGLAGTPVASLNSWEQAKARLMPRLVGPAFAQRLDNAQGSSQLYLAPLHGELRMALILQHDGRARYIRTTELEAWGVSPAMARRVALDNLGRRPVRVHHDQQRNTLTVRTGDGLDSARLLLRKVQEALRSALGDQVVIAIPHRDALIACSVRDSKAIAGLEEQTRTDAERAPHSVSSSLWQLTTTGQLIPFEL